MYIVQCTSHNAWVRLLLIIHYRLFVYDLDMIPLNLERNDKMPNSWRCQDDMG